MNTYWNNFMWFFSIDPTVQVAILGIVGTIVAGGVAAFRVWINPITQKDKKEFSPKVSTVNLSEHDRIRIDKIIEDIDKLINEVEKVGEAIERHRIDTKK